MASTKFIVIFVLLAVGGVLTEDHEVQQSNDPNLGRLSKISCILADLVASRVEDIPLPPTISPVINLSDIAVKVNSTLQVQSEQLLHTGYEAILSSLSDPLSQSVAKTIITTTLDQVIPQLERVANDRRERNRRGRN